MKALESNPSTNELPSDITQLDILNAISESGYPLQTIIADKLRRTDFDVQEEWSYIDQDSGENRAIDLVAVKWFKEALISKNKIYPKLALVTECKQSRLPYVFFLSPGKETVENFPLIVGLRKRDLTIRTDDSLSTWEVSVLDALGLTSHPFITEPAYCASFSKCVRRSDKIELSGDEPFHNLILPVLKALHHFEKVQSPKEAAMHYHCHLTIGLGVLNAPMIGVNVTNGNVEVTLYPWIRVLRHESDELPRLYFKEGLIAIDVVHKDFLQKYLSDCVLPFASQFAKLSVKHQKTLASGKGFAKGMEKYDLENLESRLRT